MAELRVEPYNAVLSTPMSNKPGRIFVQQGGRGREISIEEADTFKDNFKRKKLLPNLRRMEIQQQRHRQAYKVAPWVPL